ncbi:MAG: type II toxin-antitoxin system RelE/ParE family toxin [Gammaproteobacteria bacterium]|nr:type II toxin-antitoxin system RelE/ParE family toxin [Gammaproteobacteria bacterium]
MTLSVAFRRAAFRELVEAAEWYEERRAGLGIEFVAEINRAVELLANYPERFPLMHKDVRCVRVRRFPYSVFFRIETQRIVVLAVFHARRDPLVWQQRR